MKMSKGVAGVTLPELMVGMSVLTILMGLSAPSYSEFISKRKVAGAANLVATFFEDVKIESIKRNEFASISYKKAENGDDWCLGAVIGREVSCDCMAETPECLIDGTPSVLTNESHAHFTGVEAVLNEGMISFDPVRGILTDPTDSAAIEIKHDSEDFTVNISVNGTGRVRKCSPSDHKLVGYATCT
jgi:type IV fimbrial biogenesis protein FimT